MLDKGLIKSVRMVVDSQTPKYKDQGGGGGGTYYIIIGSRERTAR